MITKGYIIVYTTSSAFKAEKLLKRANIDIKLVPTPRHISSDCGISVYFETENTDIIKNILNLNKLEYFIA